MTAEPGAVNSCELCGGEPKWTVVRQGDVVVSWACASGHHLDLVCTALQRDFEVTELHLNLTAKAREVAEINRMIREGMPYDWRPGVWEL